MPLEQLFGTCVSASFFGAYTNDDQIAAVVGATPNESIQYREDVAMVVLERQSGDIEGVFVGRIPVDLDELAGRSVNCVASSLGLDVDGSPQIVHHP